MAAEAASIGLSDEEADEERRREAFDAMLHRPAIWVVLGLIVLAIGAASVLGWLSSRNYVSTDDAFIDADVVHVAPEISGRLAAVLVEEDQAVRRGQVLARIDPDQAQAKTDQANAGSLAAAGQLAQAQAQIAVAEAAAGQAGAAVPGRAAAARAARTELDRLVQLQKLSANAVSAQQIDNARAAVEGAQAQLVAAEEQVKTARAQIAAARVQVGAASGQLKAAEAVGHQAQLNLSYTEVLAPADGHIAHKLAAPGDLVQAGQQLMAIVPPKLWVVANLKETQLARVRRGQAVDIRADAYPDVVFRGHVASIRYGAGQAFSLLPAENATGNFVKVVQRVPVRILIEGAPDPDRPLGPGMSVHPRIHLR